MCSGIIVVLPLLTMIFTTQRAEQLRNNLYINTLTTRVRKYMEQEIDRQGCQERAADQQILASYMHMKNAVAKRATGMPKKKSKS